MTPMNFCTVILSYDSLGARLHHVSGAADFNSQSYQERLCRLPVATFELLATLLLLTGAVIGSSIAFGLVRLMGYSLVKKLISRRSWKVSLN